MIIWSMVLLLVACSTTPEVDREAANWLAQIEQQTESVTSIRAKIVYTREQGVLGDVQHRRGTLVYEAGPPAKFAAVFDQIVVDEALHPMDKTYVFDGRFMVERDGDEKIFSQWELAKEGEQVDLLALGEGPFALPLNLKKDKVLERFDVTLSDDGDDQPVHLILVPKSGMDVTRIGIWFDRETLLPVRVRSVNEESENVTDIRLRDIEVNPDDLDDNVFDTQPPVEVGWQINTTPLEEEPQMDAD